MKKLLIALPAFAVTLLLSACGQMPQPQMPNTPVSVEKALQKALAEDAATTTDEEAMEAGELGEEDVTVELDEALDALENELDAALDGEAEVEVTAEAEAQAPQIETAEEPAATAGGEENEEELIDQPIIIE